MAKSELVGEQVRLPGIINMDLEATKIRTLDEVRTNMINYCIDYTVLNMKEYFCYELHVLTSYG